MPHLNENKNYLGIGPYRTLDQRIDYVNENRMLSKKISMLRERKEFLTGLTRESMTPKRLGSWSGSARKPSCLPGIDHIVGSLSKERKRKEAKQIIYGNMKMVNELVKISTSNKFM